MPRRDILVVAATRESGKILVITESTYPWTASIGSPATFDRNRSLSSGVRVDSRIELRAGSMKCPALVVV